MRHNRKFGSDYTIYTWLTKFVRRGHTIFINDRLTNRETLGKMQQVLVCSKAIVLACLIRAMRQGGMIILDWECFSIQGFVGRKASFSKFGRHSGNVLLQYVDSKVSVTL